VQPVLPYLARIPRLVADNLRSLCSDPGAVELVVAVVVTAAAVVARLWPIVHL
jgi:hypothetical protein